MARGALRRRGAARDARGPGRPTGDRVRLPHTTAREMGADVHGLQRLSARAVRGEARRDRAVELRAPARAWPGTPGCSCGSAGRSGRRSRPRRPTSSATIERGLIDDRLRRALRHRARSTSIDYAVMEPAASAGLVVMGAMDVGWSDLGSWTALLEALGGVGERPGRPGRRVGRGRPRRPRRGARRRTARPGTTGRGVSSPRRRSRCSTGARSARTVVDALLERVAGQET